jgi:hypothetical protein
VRNPPIQAKLSGQILVAIVLDVVLVGYVWLIAPQELFIPPGDLSLDRYQWAHWRGVRTKVGFSREGFGAVDAAVDDSAPAKEPHDLTSSNQ